MKATRKNSIKKIDVAKYSQNYKLGSVELFLTIRFSTVKFLSNDSVIRYYLVKYTVIYSSIKLTVCVLYTHTGMRVTAVYTHFTMVTSGSTICTGDPFGFGRTQDRLKKKEIIFLKPDF
jgi:hypothetical protein